MTTDEILRGQDIDLTSTIPIYQQIVDRIYALVASGDLKSGDPLPTEAALCEKLGISRGTVRKAYSKLVEQERVLRRPQRGTFVAEPKIRRDLDALHNFSGEMREMGIAPSSRVLSFKLVVPPPEVARDLGLGRGEMTFKIRRLRLGDGTPQLLETAYVPRRLCPDLDSGKLTESLYEIIERATGSPAAEAHEVYEAIVIDARTADLFGCDEGIPAFLITRVTRNARGEAFERSQIVAPSDRSRYEVTRHRDGETRTGLLG